MRLTHALKDSLKIFFKDERFFETMVFMVTKNQKPSVVGMVTKKIFDGFGCWYGYKKKI